jgi:TolB-like protein
MLAGDPPFSASHPRAVLAKHLTDQAPSVTTVRPSVTASTAAAIAKALRKAPADRFESATAFTTALSSKTVVQEERQSESIVVLPFTNLSPDPENEYFSDGLTEEIISDLSKVEALRVISRTSAMQLKGTDKSTREIGRQLGVEYVLEGSVRKAGDRLRITAQLIDAEADEHLWADKYDGVMDDVFAIQETVSQSIVEALEIELKPEERRRVHDRPIDNVQAYDCYLRARFDIEAYTQVGFDRALRHLRNGLGIIGENALLYAGIGYAHWNRANQGFGGEEDVEKAEEYGRRALALDPDCAEAHLVLGLVFQAFRGDQRKGLHHLERSLAINPNDAHAALYTAVGHYTVGRPDESIPIAERFLKSDPLNLLIRWIPICVHMGNGRFHEAAASEWDEFPPIPPMVFWEALSLAHARRFDDVNTLIDERVREEWDDLYGTMTKLLGAAVQRDATRMKAFLTGGFVTTCRRDPMWSYYLGSFLSLAGQEETAFEWLSNAVRQGFTNYPLLAEHDSFLRKLREEPRFQELLKQVKQDWENFEV